VCAERNCQGSVIEATLVFEESGLASGRMISDIYRGINK
jgi:hypothetical protein